MASVLWFRRDLRINDNPLLSEFRQDIVLPVFIFDTQILNKLSKDDKRVSFIFYSVMKLKNDLKAIGLDLAIFYGEPLEVFEKISSICHIDEILACGDNDFYAKSRDEKISQSYKLISFNDAFLLPASYGLKKDGTPYRVFTPFYKSVLPFVEILSQNQYKIKSAKLVDFDYKSIQLESFGFEKADISHIPYIDKPMELLNDFKPYFDMYKDLRDDISKKPYTSGLGIHLRFGTIGIRECIRELILYQKEGIDTSEFIRELIWREFWNMLLIHFPKSEFDNFYAVDIKWENDKDKFHSWCEGKTGVPIIDAAMRELNATGFMHNRLRMIVSSFLTKDLLIDWRWGERYFAMKLLDYEASSNIGSWQWASSTGADGVPYFRVFNPYLQTKKFDKDGVYIKRWVSEYKDIPSGKLYDENYLLMYGDSFYKKPIVVHKVASERFVRAYKDGMIK
ncbi:cryptochrome/photolyase family protein [Arcobacter sp. FWKO B]|uniref:cryptochrome/photolyase family protein n=1 Tax=Arcobacter sp. FWKO B TaxID=2593672 RepID=UPI0018A3D8A0|nr:deoxyribodipyrimidine photo-lyase [Arcobacter sp. FWKO B]QOG13162.1 deoxyribodipyrimidine photo-lyase [Arcobacter sp. FWKO B]